MARTARHRIHGSSSDRACSNRGRYPSLSRSAAASTAARRTTRDASRYPVTSAAPATADSPERARVTTAARLRRGSSDPSASIRISRWSGRSGSMRWRSSALAGADESCPASSRSSSRVRAGAAEAAPVQNSSVTLWRISSRRSSQLAARCRPTVTKSPATMTSVTSRSSMRRATRGSSISSPRRCQTPDAGSPPTWNITLRGWGVCSGTTGPENTRSKADERRSAGPVTTRRYWPSRMPWESRRPCPRSCSHQPVPRCGVTRAERLSASAAVHGRAEKKRFRAFLKATSPSKGRWIATSVVRWSEATPIRSCSATAARAAVEGSMSMEGNGT